MGVGLRQDCGNAQTTEKSCIDNGCCWHITVGAPYCYKPKEGVPDVTTTNPVNPTPTGTNVTASDAECKKIANVDKIDCVADDPKWTVPGCLEKGCCHIESPGAPACYYPYGNKHEARCQMSAGLKKDCGDAKTTEKGCLDLNCCWEVVPGAPYCYKATDGGPDVTRGPNTTSGPNINTGTKIYIHVMPWFETKATNGGKWGQHWTMANLNPDQITGGKRNIASKFYPLIDLYASGDSHVIDWQLGLMKLSGVSGVLIDWPGTANVWDYPTNLANSEAIIKGCERVGLEFAIVYEDHNLGMAKDGGKISDVMSQGKADMVYMEKNYFTKSNYIKINRAPLLLDFGPQTLKSGSQWTDLFSVFKQKPTFLTLWNQMQEAGSVASGEFAWIYSNFMSGLENFYKYRNINLKLGVAYPGFDSAYTIGGWPGPTWTIPVSVNTFAQTLNAAINGGSHYVQVATWNDYGEGTMIELTKEFGYGFLTTIQKTLGVKHTQADLEQVTKLFHQRKFYSDNATRLAHLDKAFYALADLKPEVAQIILNSP